MFWANLFSCSFSGSFVQWGTLGLPSPPRTCLSQLRHPAALMGGEERAREGYTSGVPGPAQWPEVEKPRPAAWKGAPQACRREAGT